MFQVSIRRPGQQDFTPVATMPDRETALSYVGRYAPYEQTSEYKIVSTQTGDYDVCRYTLTITQSGNVNGPPT